MLSHQLVQMPLVEQIWSLEVEVTEQEELLGRASAVAEGEHRHWGVEVVQTTSVVPVLVELGEPKTGAELKLLGLVALI